MSLPQPNEPCTGAHGIGIVGSQGYALADAASYFPEDLPPDWRFGYFANDHEGAYLPADLWEGESCETLQDWADAMHPGFSCYLEASSSGEAMDVAERALGDRLAAFVHWVDADAGSLVSPEPVRPSDADGPGATATRARHIGRALRCPDHLVTDLRRGAVWLRQIASHPEAALVVLPEPSSSQLRSWTDLRTLLGIERLTT
jgi:hypothetical protein